MFQLLKRLFGSGGRSPTTEHAADDVVVTSNRDVEVNVGTAAELAADPAVPFQPGQLSVRTISIDDGPDEGGARAAAGDAGTTTPSPSAPTSAPDPGAGPYERGTFAFPDDRDFMQKVEARGVNGHGKLVETVYVLAGPTYAVPTELFRLDEPEYYRSATRRSVRYYAERMAEKIAALYPDATTPGMIARFHTHPGGTTTPSSADQESAGPVRESFADAFGTDDFEFFHGIHALKDHGTDPGPDARQDPEVTASGVSWRGEQYRHELALYGPRFRNPRTVALHDDS